MAVSEVPRASSLTELWDHQREAVSWLQLDEGNGHLLWVAMGGGKSLVAIEYARSIRLKKILILCPLSMINAWQQEFDKHTEYGEWYFVGLSTGSVEQRTRIIKNCEKIGNLVIALNYESFWRKGMIEQLMKMDFDLIICDEIHRIKTGNSKQSRGAFKLQKKSNAMRLGLSGTPFPNSIMDAFGSYRFLDPSIFGHSFVAFRARYAVVESRKGHGHSYPLIIGFQNTEEFRDKIHSIAFRVESDVLKLPAGTHVERTFELPKAARAIYDALKDDFVAQVGEGVITAGNALVRLLRLQQLTSGDAVTEKVERDGGEVSLIEGHEEVHDAKSAALDDVLEDLDEPVVIFYRFKRDLDRIIQVCQNRDLTCSELSGRKKELEEWQEGKTDCIAVQLRAGSLGISLVRARVAVFWSLSFDLAEFEQSKARTNRPGQTRAVTYVHLIAEKTVDRQVLGALRNKKNVIKAIVEQPERL